MSRLARFEERSPFFWMVVGCLGVAGVGVIDVATGKEVSFSVFYLIPIVLVVWFAGRTPGVAISVISAMTWLEAEIIGGVDYSSAAIRYWNAAVRLVFFLVVTLLLPALKALEREREIARVDDLTGIANRRHVFEVLQRELDRSQRYNRPFSLAYIDLDGLKVVNDRFGHHVGDNVLRAVADQARRHLRKTDFVGRLGGDEFVVVFPEIDQAAAQFAVRKVHAALMDEMHRHQWHVTFSIGAVTYQGGAMTADELIRRADELMYSVKKQGKNAIAYLVCAG